MLVGRNTIGIMQVIRCTQDRVVKKSKTMAESKIYQINDTYRVKTDPYCFLLERRNSKGSWGDITYHPTVEVLLEALLEREIRENLGDLQKMLEIKNEIIANFNQFAHAKRDQK